MDAPDSPPPPALTCADPGTLVLGATVSDTTTGRMNLVTAMCGGFTNLGLDAVYELDVPVGTQITVKILSGDRKAYVLSVCQQTPMTPACLGNTRAVRDAPITVTTAAQPSFIVVDDDNATANGSFVLNVQ